MANAAQKLNVEKLNETLIKQTMKKLELIGGKDLATRAETLANHFQKIFDDPNQQVEMARCNVCNGLSPIEGYENCPFCGDGEGVFDEGGEKLGDAEPAALEAEGEDAGEPDEDEDEAEDEDEETEAVESDASLTSIVVKAEQEKKLDEQVAEFWRLRALFGATGYDIAVVVHDIFTAETWSARQKDSKRAYQTFPQFVNDELQISRTHAYYLVGVARKFTREDVATVGAGVLRFALKLEGEAQTALLEEAREGKLSARDAQARFEHKAPLPKTKGKGVTPESAAAAKEAKKTALSIMVRAPAVLRLPMFASGSYSASKGFKEAKDLASDPWAEEVHENGVVTRYQVKLNAKTGIVEIHVARRRGGAKAEDDDTSKTKPVEKEKKPRAKKASKKASAKKASKKAAKKK